jgi:dienelactone hydrolase
MLRESSKISDAKFDLSNITEGLTSDTDIPNADLLIEFAEAVSLRDSGRIDAVRSKIVDEMGEDALVDSAAIAAAFHGFVRVADAIGIPYDTAVMGHDDPELRKEVGIDNFYAVGERG